MTIEINEIKEYKEIIADKDRAIDDLRKELKAQQPKNPNNIPNLDTRLQLENQKETIKELQAQIALLQTKQKQAEFPKASELQPQQQKIRPFILKKEIVPTLIADLNHSLNNDVQMFLCEDSWLYWLTGYQSTYSSERKKELAQNFEVLSQLNATS